MKYLCLISAESCMEQMNPAEAAQHFEEYRQFNLNLRGGGHFVGGNRLLPPDTAKTVRVRNGKATVTDGPWVETKEQLGGYYILEAKDIDEALQLAAKIPGSWIGCVEVRPLAEDAQTLDILALAGGSR